MNPLLLIPALGAVFLISRMVFKSRPATSPKEAASAVDTGIALLVDVREPAEWNGGVARVLRMKTP